MKCPIDGTDLVMAERQGVEIDYCPKCRGVWLDRGELDKIIDRAAAMPAPPQAQPQAAPPAPPPGYPSPGYPPHHGHGHGRPHYKKKKSWLDDMFDFG